MFRVLLKPEFQLLERPLRTERSQVAFDKKNASGGLEHVIGKGIEKVQWLSERMMYWEAESGGHQAGCADPENLL